MKQRITVQQLNELSDEQKELLRDWWKPQIYDVFIGTDDGWRPSRIVEAHVDWIDNNRIGMYDEGKVDFKIETCLPLLSIGQMCQFMDEHSPIAYRVAMVQFYSPKVIVPNREEDNEKAELMMHMVNRIELCDYLWEAVKQILK